MTLTSGFILVTGGMGLIGSAVVRRLTAADERVRIVDSGVKGSGCHQLNLVGLQSSPEIHRVDIRDAEAMVGLATGAKAVLHLAGLTSHADSMKDPISDLMVNVQGTVSVLEACRKACPEASFVFTSTRQLYGRPDRIPVDEKHPVRPPDVNAVNKYSAEQHCALYSRIHGLKTCILRLTNVYGPGMRIVDAKQMFLGIWIRNALEGKTIQVYGDGTQRRDLLFVDDAAAAVIAPLSRNVAEGLFNIGNADAISLQDLAGRVSLCATGSTVVNVPFPADRKAIDIGDYATDASLAARMLAWKPKVGLDEGLSITMAYYHKHLQAYIESSL